MIDPASNLARPRVSIILPVYNERDNLLALLDEIEQAMRQVSGSQFEVIAVDDHSTDGSDRLLRELCESRPYLRAIFFRRNCGQSAAFDAGFRHAGGELVVTMDADGQNDPADIPRMIDELNAKDLDFVAGRRGSRKDNPVHRKLPSMIANFVIRRVTGTKLRDLGCSLKLYRREIVTELRLYGEMHRFIGVLVEGLGAKTSEIQVNHRPRTAGKSKYGISRTFKVLLDLLTVWFMRGYQTKPIYVIGGIGLSLLSGAVLLSGFVLYEKLAYGIFVHRNPLFILSMIMSVVAVQFLAMGLIAELMIRTYFESQQKPPYLIGSMIGFETKPGDDDRAAVPRPPVEVYVDPESLSRLTQPLARR